MSQSHKTARHTFDVDRPPMDAKMPVTVRISQSRFNLRVPLNLRLVKTGWGDAEFPVILWKGTRHGGQWKKVENVEDCFGDFLSLSSASDEKVFDFVKRYGIINESSFFAEKRFGMIGEVGCAYGYDPGSYQVNETVEELMQRISGGEASARQARIAVEVLQQDKLKEANDLLQNPEWLKNRIVARERLANMTGKERAEEILDHESELMERELMLLRNLPDVPEQKWFFQKPQVYRRLATQAQALLRIGEALHGSIDARTEHNGQCAQPSDWQTAIHPDNPAAIKPGKEYDFIWGDDVAAQRLYFSKWVTEHWIGMARFYPVMQWGMDEQVAPTLSIEADPQNHSESQHSLLYHHADDQYGLLSLLTLQFMTILTSPRGLARCDECGKVYNPPNHKARADRRNYCSDDCSKKEQRRSEKRSREKKRMREAALKEAIK